MPPRCSCPEVRRSGLTAVCYIGGKAAQRRMQTPGAAEEDPRPDPRQRCILLQCRQGGFRLELRRVPLLVPFAQFLPPSVSNHHLIQLSGKIGQLCHPLYPICHTLSRPSMAFCRKIMFKLCFLARPQMLVLTISAVVINQRLLFISFGINSIGDDSR